MKNSLIFLTLIVVSCGPTEQPGDQTIPDNSCIVIPGLPDSGEYYVVCPDGSKIRVHTTRDRESATCSIRENNDGTTTITCPDGAETTFSSGGKGEMGDKGDSVEIIERDLQPGDLNCPGGGKAIDFFMVGDAAPTATSYQCNPINGGCQASQVLDATLGYCIPFFEVSFKGRVIESMVGELPLTLQPKVLDRCSGKISFPTGLVPTSLGSAGLGGFDANYTFGHVAAYGIEMTVDNVSFHRDVRLTTPSAVTYTKSFTPNADGSGRLRIEGKTLGLKGFAPAVISSLSIGAEQNLALNEDFTMAMPNSLSEWTGVLFPSITMEFFDDNSGASGNIVCEIDTFLP